jgi:hypothetical protein
LEIKQEIMQRLQEMKQAEEIGVYIRVEMGRMKQENEKTWSTPTNRTIYQWSEVSKTKGSIETTKQTDWTQAVRNRMRQKAGEIQVHRPYEKGTEKW